MRQANLERAFVESFTFPKIWKLFRNFVLDFLSETFPSVAKWRIQKASEYRQLGLSAYSAKDKVLSMSFLQQALEYAPRDPGLCCDVAQVFYETGQYFEAEDHFRQALRYDHSNLRALKGLGHTLQAVHRFSEAISIYVRYAELNDNDADVHFNLGLAMHDSGDPVGALRSYGRAAELAPDNPHILVVWAQALYSAGKIDQALANLRRALVLKPRDSELYRLIGLALEANGDIDEAFTSYKEALGIDGQNARAHLDFSTMLDKIGKHEEAVEHATNALRAYEEAGNKTGVAAAYWNLGWFYFHLREYEKSAEASKNAVAINGKLLGARFNLGLALLYLGHRQEAMEQYEVGAENISSASELKYWAMDDLIEALESPSPPAGGNEILSILRRRYEKLKEVRSKTVGAIYARS
jgi:tetratricopeptide (TPR) repeat protein